ncbi:protein NUCLEAR FUSION DEFECTIVE 6, mitochondrial-like [Nymphaea colorata]|nr:protein NUCLEAR FUSION DEFECTIVE 6, mitochondrial-like [Nymphaea colorata]
MASAACARRVVRSSLGSSSCRAFIGARSTGVTASSPSVARFPLLRRQSNVSCLPRVLGPVSSLMPLHTATATALMTSMLSVKSRNWGWLSEGFATPL